MRIIGYTVGEASPSRATFVTKEVPRVGQYVVMNYGDKKVLGMIQSLVRGSVALTGEIHDPAAIERIKELGGDRDHYIRGVVKILGDVESLEIPRSPPPPGTEVYEADPETLRRIFGGDNRSSIRLGVLIAQPEVPVYVDVNKMVTRHLAILAVTGAGKSNTVAVLADRIAGLNGAVLIFDMHSEYVNADFTQGRVNPIKPEINPLTLSTPEFLRLLNVGQQAYTQERYFRKALREARSRLYRKEVDAQGFLDAIRNVLEEYMEDERYRGDKNSIVSLLNKVEALVENYGFILNPYASDIVDQLRLGHVNVVDLGQLDEEVADVIVSHTLSSLLRKRKAHVTGGRDGLPYPVFVVLEEAHILAPKDRNTISKHWISRVAREGRKFGVGLCLVSQRPKALDADTLSQANNMIVLRLVEPSDQRYVQEASEALSEDLVEQLPSLNVGEAVVLGMMVKVPALVKIDKFEGKLVGGDIDVVAAWRSQAPTEETARMAVAELDDLLDEW